MKHKIQLWNRERVIENIGKYLMKTERNSIERNCLKYPLSDILAEFYNRSVVIGEDFHSLQVLENLYKIYKTTHLLFKHTIKDLIDNGWISVLLGRWEHPLLRSNPFKGENLTDYEQGEIIEFLLWLLEKEEETIPFIEIVNPNLYIMKWKNLYPDIPNLQEFLDKGYLQEINDKYYIWNNYSWDKDIDEALAKLWLFNIDHTSRNDFDRWLTIARSVNGTYGIMTYLNRVQQNELLNIILDECVLKCTVPTLDTEEKFFNRRQILENKNLIKTNIDTRLFSDNRAINITDFERRGFDYNYFLHIREIDIFLILYIVYNHLNLISEDKFEILEPILNAYDMIGITNIIRLNTVESVLELCLHYNTQFIGFRLLLTDIGQQNDHLDNYVECYLDVMSRLLKDANKYVSPFNPKEIAMLLLYLAEKSLMRSSIGSIQDTYWKVLDGIVRIIREDDKLFELMSEEICDYYETLLLVKNVISWTRAYYLINFCMEQWFYKKTKMKNIPTFSRMQKMIMDGFILIFQSEKVNYANFLENDYIYPNIWSDIYNDIIEKKTIKDRRKLLMPIQISGNTKKDDLYVIRHQYRILLTILCDIYEMHIGNCDPVRDAIIECLEIILNRDSNLFDYTNIQIFHTEEPIRRSIGIIDSEKRTFHCLMDLMLNADVPDLLIYFDACKDIKFKEQLKIKIDQKQHKDSLDVFSNQHAIDLVMNNKIMSLYPAVESNLKNHLQFLQDQKCNPSEVHYQQAVHQLSRLSYIRGDYEDILNGDNQFFKAIVFMEVDTYKDYYKATVIWEGMIKDKDKMHYSSMVFINFLILLYRRMEEISEHDTYDNTQEFTELKIKFNNAVFTIENEEINKWSKEEKEKYCIIQIQEKVLLGEDFADQIYQYNSKYQLKLRVDDFMKKGESVQTEEELILSAQKVDSQISDFICTLLSSCIKLQSHRLYSNASEDERNDYIADLLETAGYQIKDQTRRGSSATGKLPGEVDIYVGTNGMPFTIIEALNLDSLNTTYLDIHLDKIYTYDTTGNAFNVCLSYVKVKDFSSFWGKYCEYVNKRKYPFALISSNINADKDYKYSEIRFMTTTHIRSGKTTRLYHLCVKIQG